MKRTTLTQQLSEAKADIRYQQGRYEEASKRVATEQQRNDRLEADLTRSRDQHANLARHLFEIIRWHSNPETTKHPFAADKAQRDPSRGFNGEYL